jgi:hypothetical protein
MEASVRLVLPRVGKTVEAAVNVAADHQFLYE